MKTSDVEKEIAARSGTAARNPVGESLIAANAKGVGHNVGWRDTAVGMTEGAVESDPVNELFRQARRIDRSVARDMLTDRLHALLDDLLDEEEEKVSKRSTARDSQAASGGGCGRSFTCDRGALDSKSFRDLDRTTNRVH